MRNNIISFIAGAVFGAAALAIGGLCMCEFVEALPEGAPTQSDESDDFED